MTAAAVMRSLKLLLLYLPLQQLLLLLHLLLLLLVLLMLLVSISTIDAKVATAAGAAGAAGAGAGAAGAATSEVKNATAVAIHASDAAEFDLDSASCQILHPVRLLYIRNLPRVCLVCAFGGRGGGGGDQYMKASEGCAHCPHLYMLTSKIMLFRYWTP